MASRSPAGTGLGSGHRDAFVVGDAEFVRVAREAILKSISHPCLLIESRLRYEQQLNERADVLQLRT